MSKTKTTPVPDAQAVSCDDRVSSVLGTISPDLASFLRKGRGAPVEEALSDARTTADLLASLDNGRLDGGGAVEPEFIGRVGHLLQRQLALAARLYELERQGTVGPAPVGPIHGSD